MTRVLALCLIAVLGACAADDPKDYCESECSVRIRNHVEAYCGDSDKEQCDECAPRCPAGTQLGVFSDGSFECDTASGGSSSKPFCHYTGQ